MLCMFFNYTFITIFAYIISPYSKEEHFKFEPDDPLICRDASNGFQLSVKHASIQFSSIMTSKGCSLNSHQAGR